MCVYVCVCWEGMGIWALVNMETRGIDFSGAGVIGYCELPYQDARIGLQSSIRAPSALNPWAIPSAPRLSSIHQYYRRPESAAGLQKRRQIWTWDWSLASIEYVLSKNLKTPVRGFKPREHGHLVLFVWGRVSMCSPNWPGIRRSTYLCLCYVS